MTISYSASVSTSRGLISCFVKLLRKWRGSIYKLIYCDLLVFLSIYYSINMTYRFLLNPEQKKKFHSVVGYFSTYNDNIPIAFVLGFYVSIVVQRWCQQLVNIPWPDPTAVFVSSQVRGNDERGRKMRRTVMRYICLCQIMVFMLISPKVKKRFPTYDHLVEAGVLNENEKKIIMAMDEMYPKQSKYWMPIVWASSIFTRARKEGRIRDDFALRTLNDSINSFRQYCITLLHYDTISVPLVYTQTVSLAVYLYFCASVIGNQWTEVKHKESIPTVDFYFPLFSTLEFFFFMGWLKVAETLICPFGEDDDDFEVNAMIDRNLKISYIIVDDMHNKHPQLMKDQYWDEVYPQYLPGGGSQPPIHSTAYIDGKISASGSATGLFDDFRDSKARLIWKRPLNEIDAVDQKNISTDSEAINEHIVIKHIHSLDSLTSLYKEGEQEQEQEEEQETEEYTFEKLREEREREKIERQQQKIQRTVDNVVGLTPKPPKRPTSDDINDDSKENNKDETAQENENEKKDDKEKKYQ